MNSLFFRTLLLIHKSHLHLKCPHTIRPLSIGTYACVLLFFISAFSYSEEGADGKAQYVHLQPAFVLNYGSNTTGRLKYIRTDVALRVLGAAAAGKVNHHQPYIRHQLVLLLSQQEDEIINNTQGREKLRQTALQEIRALMSELEGQPFVEDLFFQNFVAQN